MGQQALRSGRRGLKQNFRGRHPDQRGGEKRGVLRTEVRASIQSVETG